jgi:thiol-disulfide isomerase/thioredoxin
MLRIHTGFLGILASCTIAFSAPIPAHAADERYILDITTPQAFPNVHFTDLAGKPLSLDESRGKLTIVHFWATWCAPCVDELPELDEIQKKYEVVGLKVISISLDGIKNKDKVENFIKANKIGSLKPYFDDNATDAFKASHAKGMPTSFFIDSSGNRIAISEGKLDWLDAKTAGFLEFNLYKK